MSENICLTEEEREALRRKYNAYRPVVMGNPASGPTFTFTPDLPALSRRGLPYSRRMTMPLDPRTAAIVQAYNEGFTMAQIAARFGGNPISVGCLARKHGGKRPLKKDAIIAWLLAFPELSDKEVAEQVSCNHEYVKWFRRELGIPLLSVKVRRARIEKVLQLKSTGLSLRKVAIKMGTTKSAVQGIVYRARMMALKRAS